MRRVLIAALAVCVAGSVYAVDLKLSGGYYARGTMIDNYSLKAEKEDIVQFAFYDHALDLNADLVVNDRLSVNTVWEIKDETWKVDQGGSLDQNIAVNQAYLKYKTESGTDVKAGIMAAGLWGARFFDLAYDAYKVQVGHPFDFGYVFGYQQKDAEIGAQYPTFKDMETHDKNQTGVGAFMKFGDINFKPLVVYYMKSAKNAPVHDTNGDSTVGGAGDFAGSETGQSRTLIDISLDGQTDAFGWEFELVNYSMSDSNTGAKGWSLMGAYANFWMPMGANKFGAWFAYDTVDKESGKALGYGTDFNSGLILGGEFYGLGSNAISGLTNSVDDANDLGAHANSAVIPGSQINGATTIGLYGEFAMSDYFTLKPAFIYVMSNWTDDAFSPTGASAAAWYKGSAMELDVVAEYQLTKELMYKAGFGYATVTYNGDVKDATSMKDPKPIMLGYHSLNLTF
jgi:hypothetical protein